MKSFKISGFSICLIFLVGCDSPKPSVQQERVEEESGVNAAVAVAKEDEPSDWVRPLEVGQRSDYLFMISGPGMRPMRYEVSHETVGTEEIDGETYYKVEVDMGGCPQIPDHVQWERDAVEGRYLIIERDGERSEAFLMLPKPLPLEVGEEWTIDPPFEEPARYWIAGYETLTLLGTTHEDCRKVSFTREFCKGHVWHKPGFGAVKLVFEYYEGGLMVYLRRFEKEEPKKTADGEAPPAVED